MNFARDEFVTLQLNMQTTAVLREHSTIPLLTIPHYTWQQCERFSSSGITPPHLPANCSVAMYPYEWQHTRQPKTNRRNVATCQGRYLT